MKFEGEDIDDLKITFRQFKGALDQPLHPDEIVILKVVAKVSEVSHRIDRKSGRFVRDHIVHVQEVTLE